MFGLKLSADYEALEAERDYWQEQCRKLAFLAAQQNAAKPRTRIQTSRDYIIEKCNQIRRELGMAEI
jgi:uncharacterized protein YutD